MWTQRGNRKVIVEQVPFLNTLNTCMNSAILDGFTESFKVTPRGLYAISKGRYYRPEQVMISKSYQIENQKDPEDVTTLYMLETSDGLKGTLLDAHGNYADALISKFVKEVETIKAKIDRYNQHEC